jgi:5-methylcytosine-specific restriction protein A
MKAHLIKPKDSKRSGKWPKVRRDFLKGKVCAVCGYKGPKLEAHHVKPFHLHPADELDPANLVALCEEGHEGVNCHLLIGHAGNFQGINPDARRDAAMWSVKLASNKKFVQAQRAKK